MAHTHAALKDIRKTKKRTAKNADAKKTILYLKKQALKSVAAKDATKASEYLGKLTKAVDKAAGRKIISKNTAARRKSRIAVKIAALKHAS